MTSKTALLIYLGIAIGSLVMSILIWLFTTYTWQGFQCQFPITKRLISPLPASNKPTVIELVPKNLIEDFSVTPTPTKKLTPKPTTKPKPKSRGFIPVAYAEESYPYQQQISKMDEGQRAVMVQVESTLGKAYAELIFRESGFHPCSINGVGNDCSYMGPRAGGLGQANPRTKMDCELTNIDCQLNWIKNYVEHRYTSIENALLFHDQKGWY